MKGNKIERIRTLYTAAYHASLIKDGEPPTWRECRIFDQWAMNGWFKYLPRECAWMYHKFVGGTKQERREVRDSYLKLVHYVKLKKEFEELSKQCKHGISND